jgi:hypothetical protein
MDDKQVFIPKNSLVEIFFKNGTIVKGTVLIWNDKKGLLQAENSNRMIIYNPNENVMMIKLILTQDEISNNTDDSLCVEDEQQSIEQAQELIDSDIDNVPQEENNFDSRIIDRAKKLVKLRLAQGREERQQVATKLKESQKINNPPLDTSKHIRKIKTEYYESPNFQKSGPFFSSRKKNS